MGEEKKRIKGAKKKRGEKEPEMLNEAKILRPRPKSGLRGRDRFSKRKG